jgi:hypothetical protein
MEKYPDGLALERRFDTEVREFVKGATGVEGDDVAAAILLRDAEKMAVLRALQQNIITTAYPVDLEEDEVSDLVFKVV